VAGGHWVADLLYETAPGEPLVLLGVAAGLLLIGVLASLLPARRAVLVQPVEALRLE
jgi:ABC-type lipoprotein release transport system permease subunit